MSPRKNIHDRLHDADATLAGMSELVDDASCMVTTLASIIDTLAAGRCLCPVPDPDEAGTCVACWWRENRFRFLGEDRRESIEDWAWLWLDDED